MAIASIKCETLWTHVFRAEIKQEFLADCEQKFSLCTLTLLRGLNSPCDSYIGCLPVVIAQSLVIGKKHNSRRGRVVKAMD